MKKKLSAFALMAAFALSLTSCCCGNNDCEPCCTPPRPRCCEPQPSCARPCCPPRCAPTYYDNGCCP